MGRFLCSLQAREADIAASEIETEAAVSAYKLGETFSDKVFCVDMVDENGQEYEEVFFNADGYFRIALDVYSNNDVFATSPLRTANLRMIIAQREATSRKE